MDEKEEQENKSINIYIMFSKYLVGLILKRKTPKLSLRGYKTTTA
jgi:hypothetical protein